MEVPGGNHETLKFLDFFCSDSVERENLPCAQLSNYPWIRLLI